MKESVAIAKEANTKKDFSPTRSDNSILRLRDEPERQLGSLRSVIGNIRHDGGTPSLDSIATELSSMHTAQRASVLLALQRTHGNRYVQRVVAGIQAKLKVGQPGDVYEQEADRVADEVMRMPEPEVRRQPEEEEEELQAKPLAEQITPFVQKQPIEEEEEELQAKELSSQASEVTPNLEVSINALRGGGQPLPASTRAFFEPRFGYDFSQVQVHTDAKADTLNRALNARAFTTGQDIFFHQGVYNPGSSSGRELLAHELTHVVQQSAGYLPLGQAQGQRADSGHLINVTQHIGREETLNKQEGGRTSSPITLKTSVLIQRALENRQAVQDEIEQMTEATTIPPSVIRELLTRLRLRRRILGLQQRRVELQQRHWRCFPNGDCGFVGITQPEYTARNSALLDRIFRLRRAIHQEHWEPVTLANVRMVIADPLGQDLDVDDALRIAETTYTFEEEEPFRVETQWERVRQFPSLPQERPHQGLVYQFIAVTMPADIHANTVASAETARNAVRSNRAIHLPDVDHADVVRVSSIESFIRFFSRLNTACQRDNLRVRQLEIFSHGGLDGPIFGDNRRQFGLNGAPPLSALPRLPYTGDAIVFFRGCRIGAGQFLGTFARQQGVATYGFEGTTSFSNRPESFYAWSEGTPAYQLEFPGSETVSQLIDRHPRATPPRGYVPRREVVQRKAQTENTISASEELEPFAQYYIEPKEKTIQSQTLQVTPGLDACIYSPRGGGHPLPRSVQAFFEPRFGYDFSQVRVHSGSQGTQLAKRLHARAFTVGYNIVFGASQYAPETLEGKRLLAHELTHVVQQQYTQLRPEVSGRKDTSAVRAERVASTAVLRENAVPVRAVTSVPLLARSDEAISPDEIGEWSSEWLRGHLTTDALELVVQRWRIAPGADTGSGSLGVMVRGGRSYRGPLRRDFIHDFQSHFSGQTLPRGREFWPGIQFFAALSEINIAFSIDTGTEYVGLVEPNLVWTNRGWASRQVEVNLLRLGGPVTITASLALDDESIGSLTQTHNVVTPGVSPSVAAHVMRFGDVIERVCSELGMRPDVVMAIISMETRGDPRAGAGTRHSHIGLMQAGTITRERGESQEAHHERLEHYLENIEQQIRDGIVVFQQKRQTLERNPYNFQFSTPMTEDDLITIHMAYGAGELTMRLALARATHLNREDWWGEDIWIPAIVQTGAHHPPFAVTRHTRNWTREQFRHELMTYCDMSAEQVDSDFPTDSRQTIVAMRSHLISRVNDRKRELHRSIDVNQVSLEELEQMDLWVYRSALFKYGNLDPRGNYMNQYMAYRRYYESVLAGHWVPPVIGHIVLTDDELVEGSPGGGASPEEEQPGEIAQD